MSVILPEEQHSHSLPQHSMDRWSQFKTRWGNCASIWWGNTQSAWMYVLLWVIYPFMLSFQYFIQFLLEVEITLFLLVHSKFLTKVLNPASKPTSHSLAIDLWSPSYSLLVFKVLVYLLVWNTPQATPLCLSLELSLHMWLRPFGSISRSTHSNTTGAWCPHSELSALSLFVFNHLDGINAAP